MLPGTFPSVRPAKCGSLPTPSQQHVCRRPQRQASITYSDEVPQVKVENRERLLLSHERAYAHVSLFPFFAFTSSPTFRKTVIHRSIGVKALLKSLHILLFPRGFFFDNPLFSQRFAHFHHKKNGKFDQCLRPPEPLRGVLFSSKGSAGAATHKPFIHGGLRSTFSAGRCPSQHGSRLELLLETG